MSDIMRTDELTSGVWIKNRHPLRGFPWQKVQNVRQIDEGTVVPIFRISFNDSGLDLIANGDREFEVSTTEPAEMTVFKAGLALPPS